MVIPQLKAVLYLRVSLDRYARLRALAGSEDRGSIPRQERAGMDLIDRMPGWTLEAIKFDSESASQYAAREREQWPEVLAMIEAGQCNVVVLWETARGDRELTTWSGFLDLCAATGTLIHVIDHDTTYDVRKPRDWEILADEGVRNARESRKTSARVRSAKAHLRKTGRPDGPAPYGYRSIYDPGTGILLGREPDPATRRHAEWIFETFHGGDSIRRIKQEMLVRDPSRRWPAATIRHILRNPRYMGQLRDGEDWVTAQWEPIVDPGVWWEIQERMDANVKSGSRPAAAKWLCSSLATTPCSGYLTHVSDRQPSVQKRTAKRHPFYRCHQDGCVGIRADWLDGHIKSLVVGYWARPDIRTALAEHAEQSSTILAGLRKRRRELDARLVEIGHEGAALPMATVVAMTETVQAELSDVERRIERATPMSARPLLEGANLAEVEAAWDQMTVAGLVGAQREIIRGTLEYVRVHPRGRGGWRTFDPSVVDAPFRKIGLLAISFDSSDRGSDDGSMVLLPGMSNGCRSDRP